MLPTGDSLLFSAHLKRSTQGSNICFPHPATLLLHWGKGLVIWCRWFTTQFLLKVIEKTFGNGSAFQSANVWLTGADLASTKVVVYPREAVFLGLDLRELWLEPVDCFFQSSSQRSCHSLETRSAQEPCSTGVESIGLGSLRNITASVCTGESLLVSCFVRKLNTICLFSWSLLGMISLCSLFNVVKIQSFRGA